MNYILSHLTRVIYAMLFILLRINYTMLSIPLRVIYAILSILLRVIYAMLPILLRLNAIYSILSIIHTSGTLGLTLDGRDVEEPGDVVLEEQHKGVLHVVLRVPGVGLGDAARAEEPVAAALVL